MLSIIVILTTDLCETNLRRERQLEGIAKAKAAGVYKGPPASIDAAQVRAIRRRASGHRKLQRHSRSAARRSIGCWTSADGLAAGGPLPNDTRFVAHEKTRVASKNHRNKARMDRIRASTSAQ
jgi:hypothetical protein